MNFWIKLVNEVENIKALTLNFNKESMAIILFNSQRKTEIVWRLKESAFATPYSNLTLFL